MKTTILIIRPEPDAKIENAGINPLRHTVNRYMKMVLASALLAVVMMSCDIIGPETPYVDPLVGEWQVSRVECFKNGQKDYSSSNAATALLDGIFFNFLFKGNDSYEITFETPSDIMKETGKWNARGNVIYLTRFESEWDEFPSEIDYMILDDGLRLKMVVSGGNYYYYYCLKQ